MALPAWLAHNRKVEADIERPLVGVNRSETVEQLHARILRERGERWDQPTQRWVKA